MNSKEARLALYRQLNEQVIPGQVLFVGSSLMEQFPIESFVQEYHLPFQVYNRGIGGYTIPELDAALETCVLDLKPARIFINIGTNDLTVRGSTVEGVMQQYEALLKRIRAALPQTEITLMAYYPVNIDAAPLSMKPALTIRSNERICEANRAVAHLADRLGLQYIDINRNLKDAQGRLRADYTVEGMHIKPEGYRAIMDDLMPYVMDAFRTLI